MTATPRLYTEGAKAKAASHDVEVFSMDDPATYGPELHRLPFSRAVERDLLSDYKVVVLAMSEQHVDAALQAHLASGDSEINITDAAKIVGCWRALQNPENKRLGDAPIQHLTRAIAFTNTIVSSKRLEAHWDSIVGHAHRFGCPRRSGRTRSAAKRATSMDSITRLSVRPVSNGSRPIPREPAAFSRTPGAYPRESTCQRSTRCSS